MLYERDSGKELPKAFPNCPRVPSRHREGSEAWNGPQDQAGHLGVCWANGGGAGGGWGLSGWVEMALKVSATESWCSTEQALKTSEWLSDLHFS